MRLAIASALLLLPCDHATRGETRTLDLDAVARGYRDVTKSLALQVRRVRVDDALAQSFDSGLPACRARARRTARVDEVPAELVGTTLHFGPRPREGAVHVITTATSLKSVAGGVLASPELAARLDVRCVPSTVRLTKATEVTLDEGD